jgi:hypothetical protein
MTLIRDVRSYLTHFEDRKGRMDRYIQAWPFVILTRWRRINTRRSQRVRRPQYKGAIQVVRDVWGDLHPDEVGPTHVQELMDTPASTPQKANTV